MLEYPKLRHAQDIIDNLYKYLKTFLFLFIYSAEMNIPVESCETGWSYFNGNCYKKIDDLLNWHDSNEACKREGANLASIHSKQEQQFLLLGELLITVIFLHLVGWLAPGKKDRLETFSIKPKSSSTH